MNSSQQSIMRDARIFLTFFYFFISLSISSSAWASRVGPSSMEWMQTNTTHFRIIHDKKQQDLGLYYAQIAETAYNNLSTIFTTLPEMTTVVLADNTDNSNGNATVFPYPLIYAFPVQVGQQDALSESGDWGKELLTHELTHVAQLYPYSATGYKIARAIFGSVISPHLLTPNWWKEGMAVEMETQLSARGRTRSYLQDAQIRSYVTKNKLSQFSLAEANENLVTWPYGNRRYFFGSMLMSQISYEGNLQHKPDAIGQIVLNQSYRLPYTINASVDEILNTDYDALYQRTLSAYEANSRQQINTLEKVPLSTALPLDESLLQSRSIQYSEAQDLIGFVATTDMKTQIRFYKISADNTLVDIKLKHLPAEDLGSFTFHPTEPKIVYSKTHQVTLQQEFSDLYVYDLAKEKSEKLTLKERARDPLYAPDGQSVLFTHTANGLTELKQINVATNEIKSILKTTPQFRINSYAYKNPQEILYTLRDADGEQTLHLLNLKTLESQTVPSRPQMRFIKYQHDTLYFNSTENGVQNIYSAKIHDLKLKDVKPLTHLLTGALSFDIDPKNKKVFATVVGERGPYVASIPFLPEGTQLPVIKNEILSRYKKHKDITTTISTSSSDYSVATYIYPHYWIPFISTNITGNGVLYQALTSASDPLGYHSYAAQLNYDSYSQKVGYSFNYLNAQWDWEFNLAALQTQQLFGIDTYVRKSFYTFAVIPDIISLNEDWIFNLGVTSNQTEDTFATTNHLGGYVQAVYDSIKQRTNHYYPMTGFSLIAKYQNLADQNNQVNPRLGNYSQGILSFTSYNHWFFPKDHTLMIKLDGLYTFEDVSTRFGTSNLSLPSVLETAPLFMIRGYQAGQFLGNQLATMNLEYRFPLIDLISGDTSVPFFAKYLIGDIFIDGIAGKGVGYDATKTYVPTIWNEHIYSAGAELRLSTTVGYVLPLSFIYGVYFPLSKKFSDESTVSGLSIQLGLY